ncbi:MAG: aminoacyl-tRNA hydrolase [Planctomycetes bacterium]|nr:aminoacyl-tRNA hydrolase [Planctomycetota bacterium]
MKIVVGLGNPGRKYEATRHNVGFRVVDCLARRHGAAVTRDQFLALMGEARIGGERVCLLKPMTYMNLSGQAVRAALDWFKEVPEQVLVVSDDLALPLGKLRVRRGGSSGGQKGLASILQHLGTEAFPRVRIGIGAVPPRMAAADFVLTPFGASETAEMERAIGAAADAVECWVARGVEPAMNKYNTAPAESPGADGPIDATGPKQPRQPPGGGSPAPT